MRVGCRQDNVEQALQSQQSHALKGWALGKTAVERAKNAVKNAENCAKDTEIDTGNKENRDDNPQADSRGKENPRFGCSL